MSSELLTLLVVVPSCLVVAALFAMMWLEARVAREWYVAIAAASALAIWLVLAALLALRGQFVQPDAKTTPPIGINLVVVFAGLAVLVAGSPTLRRLLANQRNLIRLNVWRLEGFVFLLLAANGQMPWLWALPSGVGDVLIGSTAFWVASRLDLPGGTRRAVTFNVLGLLDLIVAVGLGITTNMGPLQLFETTPTSELVTHFPLALVPTFLVPLAFAVHIVSLWQLFRGSWRSEEAIASERRICATRRVGGSRWPRL